jgi:hypothetical protein
MQRAKRYIPIYTRILATQLESQSFIGALNWSGQGVLMLAQVITGTYEVGTEVEIGL